jgi:hypothetical protein
MNHATDPARALLRHTLATLAYRAGKVLRDAPPDFAGFSVGPATRTPSAILAHMGDLFDWALTMAQDRTAWNDSQPLAWDAEVARFFTALRTFDDYLAGAAPLKPGVIDKLFQGPVADALTHTGQLGMLRRLAGTPVRGESYARAEIVAGRVGVEQAAPRWEFDS